ncbi:ATP-binding protein [Halobacteriovorax sp. HLS]|uniref:ATP-binding protein n=1 Tax=Halobacteriovorax sp. HLS TaxID=2234000 RepID=UPI000FDACDA3|nr:ATP-binding protein [Halobacteriovorax sp. HLS]
MASPIQISLKIKIIVSIIILLALSLVSTLKFSIDIFEEDKKSYIFENALTTSEQLSEQLEDLLVKGTKEAAIITELFKLSRPLALKQINSSDVLVGIKVGKSFLYNMNKLKQMNIQRNTLDTLNIENKLNDHHDHVNAPLLSVKRKDKVIIFDYSSLLSTINRNKAFQISIYYNKTTRMFKSAEASPELLNNVNTSELTKGTKEESINQNEILYSFVKSKNGIVTLVTIPKNKAFIATQMLKKKSTYFGLSLLFLFIVIGTFFSVTLTKPIEELLKGTKNVAQGIYNKEISVKSNDEFGVLSSSFNSMSSKIYQLISTLEEYNKNLESMVEQRTKELSEANEFIKAMVNSLDQGLLVFNKDGICNDIYTNACEKIFDKKPANLPFSEVLGLDDKETKNFISWKDVLFQELLPFESSAALGPQQVIKGDSIDSSDFKHVDLSYYPLKDTENKLANIVSVATDITKQVKSQKAFEQKEAYVAMVLKIINNKVQFFSFIKEVQATLDNISLAINENTPNIEYILMNWHSLNGGMGIFKISDLQQQARENESKLVSFKLEPPSNIKEQLKAQLTNFQMNLDKYLESTQLFFGTSWKNEQEKTVLTKEQIQKLEDLIQNSNSDSLKDYFNEQFTKTPIDEFFKGYDELIQDSASKVGKDIAPLEIRGGQLRINPQEHEELFSVMVHLFRNCVDHGIESPQKRIDCAKEQQGKIEVEFKRIKSKGKPWLSIHVSDDGAGIDPARIRAKLNELHPTENFDQISDEEIIYKIFEPTFTTTEVVSELSGRGVGMSAIKDVIDKKRGSMKVTSTMGSGSHFIFSVPE